MWDGGGSGRGRRWGGGRVFFFFLFAAKQDGYISATGLEEGGGIKTSQMVSVKAASIGYIYSSDVTFPGNCVISKGDENAQYCIETKTTDVIRLRNGAIISDKQGCLTLYHWVENDANGGIRFAYLFYSPKKSPPPPPLFF